jgi:hypothetical protein
MMAGGVGPGGRGEGEYCRNGGGEAQKMGTHEEISWVNIISQTGLYPQQSLLNVETRHGHHRFTS